MQQPELKRHLLFPRHDKKSEATSSEDALEALRAENAELREVKFPSCQVTVMSQKREILISELCIVLLTGCGWHARQLVGNGAGELPAEACYAP